MRFLLMITIGVSLTGGYLYWAKLLPFGLSKTEDIKQVAPVETKPTLPKKKPVIAKAKISKPKPKPKKTRKKLNLSLPDDFGGGATRVSFPDPSTSRQNLNWTKLTRSKEEIKYGAELVFDAKEGSTITGGKVSVKIPLG